MPRFLHTVNSAFAVLKTKVHAIFSRRGANSVEQSGHRNINDAEQTTRATGQATDTSTVQHEEYEPSLRTLVDWRSETTTIVPTLTQHNIETIYEHDRFEEEGDE
ncbi:hypothetical protein EWM64_g6564 [Hericium alpestre]|uniref:Uncharacterized protein n=1 Tax=Hericium alpestre TaxID=135208 RepID=A0A4Y9ZVC8_9AGAM|nr:hypothetical protein EWM64_g6564 [Hericium alpestre]